MHIYGFPSGSAVKNLSVMQETQFDCWVGRSLGGGNGNPLHYSCLENPMDRGAWQATYSPWGRKQSDMTEHIHSSELASTHVCVRMHVHTHTHTSLTLNQLSFDRHLDCFLVLVIINSAAMNTSLSLQIKVFSKDQILI